MANRQRIESDIATNDRRVNADNLIRENRIKNDELTTERRLKADKIIVDNRQRNDEMTADRRKRNDKSSMPWAVFLLILVLLAIGAYFILIK